MNDPLNELPFDINTLIPFEQFNWDTVQGLEQINKDITGVQQSIVKNTMSGLTPVVNAIASVQANVVQPNVDEMQNVEQLTNGIKQNISNNINSQVQGTLSTYGNGSQDPMVYFVYRMTDCNTMFPYPEVWRQPPNNREWYGPFGNFTIVQELLRYNQHIKQPSQIRIGGDDELRYQFQTEYDDLARTRGINASGLTYDVGVGLVPQDQGHTEIDPAQCSVPTRSVDYPLFQQFMGDCTEFLRRTWSLHNPPLPGYDPQWGAMWTTVDGYYLTDAQWGTWINACGIPPVTHGGIKQPVVEPLKKVEPEPIEIPKVVPLPKEFFPTPSTPAIQPAPIIYQTAKEECCPNETPKSIEECCEMLANKMDKLTSAIISLKTPHTNIDELPTDCADMGDGAFSLSNCGEIFANRFLERENIVEIYPAPYPDIGSWITHLNLWVIGEANTTNIDDDMK